MVQLASRWKEPSQNPKQTFLHGSMAVWIPRTVYGISVYVHMAYKLFYPYAV